MKLFKQTINFIVMLGLLGVLSYLTYDIIEYTEVFKNTDYADVKGCTAEDFDFSGCA